MACLCVGGSIPISEPIRPQEFHSSEDSKALGRYCAREGFHVMETAGFIAMAYQTGSPRARPSDHFLLFQSLSAKVPLRDANAV